MKGERYMMAIKEKQMVMKEKTYAVAFCIGVGVLFILVKVLLLSMYPIKTLLVEILAGFFCAY